VATWVLTRGLTTVRTEFDKTWPGRDKSSDGSVGDLAHQLESASGHNPDITGRAEYKDGDSKNEVRAIDVDKDLVPGSSEPWMERVVQYLVKKARAGGYIPFRYLIFNGRIWSRTDGWKTRTYTGSNKHDKHLHASGDYTQKADEWTGSLGLATVRGTGGDMLVKKGDSGEEVKFWQYVLADLGYSPGDIDGDYGAKTEAAVNKFRADNNAGPTPSITGWCGMALLRKMMDKRAGKDGAAGKAGAPGAPGKDGAPGQDGTFSGTLEITGGTITARAVEG
jgi:Putative peptidoglycan binding domain